MAKAASYAIGALKGLSLKHFIAGAAVYSGIQYISKEIMKGMEDSEITGVTQTSRLAAGARKIIYGTVRTGGQLVYSVSKGTDNETLYQAIALADTTRSNQKAISELIGIYFNGELIANYDNSDGSITYTTEGNKYADYTDFEFHDGTQQTVSPMLNATGAEWHSSMKLRGVAYVVCKFTYDQDTFVNGLPNVSFSVKGRTVYDPRDMDQNSTQASTWTYSNNPVLCLMDYLTDPAYGLGITIGDIDTTSIYASLAHCDEDVEYYPANNPNTTLNQNRYECDGHINSDNKVRANIENILTSMAGKISYANGKFHIISTQSRSPVTTVVDEDMMCGQVSVTTKVSRSSQYNVVQGKFLSKEKGWVEASYPTQKDSSYIAEDGQEMILDLTLPMTTDNARAQRIAKYTLKRSRRQATISMQLKLAALKFRVGDIIKVSYDKFGYTEKKFEVQNLKIIPDPEKGIYIEIEGLEYDPNDTVWSVLDQIENQQELIANQYDPSAVSAPDEIEAYFSLKTDDDGNVTPKIEMTIYDNPSPFITHYQLYIYRLPEQGAQGHEEFIPQGIEFTLTRDFGFRKQHSVDIVDRRVGTYRIAVQAVNTSGVYSDLTTDDFEIEAEHQEIIAPADGATVILQTLDVEEFPTEAEIEEAKGSPPKPNDVIIVQEVDNSGVIVDAVTYTFLRGIEILEIRETFANHNFYSGYGDRMFVDIWLSANGASNGTWSSLITDNTTTTNIEELSSRSTTTIYNTPALLDTLKNEYVTWHNHQRIGVDTANEYQKLIYTNAYIEQKKAGFYDSPSTAGRARSIACIRIEVTSLYHLNTAFTYRTEYQFQYETENYGYGGSDGGAGTNPLSGTAKMKISCRSV